MMLDAERSQEFHLFIEEVLALSSGTSFAGCAGTPPTEPLIIPRGVSRLVWAQNGPAQLRMANAQEDKTAPLLECLEHRPRPSLPRLLLVSPPQSGARVNGLPAPPLAILAEGDRFSFDDSCHFRLAIFHRPRLGPVPDELAGVPCPICTIPLQKGDRSLVCFCGAPMHLAEDEEREGALACAKMAAECPRCGQPTQTVPGYTELSRQAHE